MQERRSKYEYEDLLACGRGELFVEGPQLPLPPMLMFDHISEIAEVGGEYGKGLVRAVLELKPDPWFFPCHFKGDPVMPGCLGLDALWQLLGFFLGWPRARTGRTQILRPGSPHGQERGLRHRHQAGHAQQARARHRRRLAVGGRLDHLSGDRPQGRSVPRRSDAAERRLTAAGGARSAHRDADEACMRRVVVTGMGIVSSIGNNTQEVLASLREAKSGISRADKYAELGFRCQVHGAPTLNAEEAIDRRAMRFLGGGAAWNHVAMEQAIRDAGLEDGEISHEMTGIIMGSGGPSTRAIVEAADTARNKSPKRVGPFAVPKAMSSTASATLAPWFKIKGVNYSISSACATSNLCIGNAAEVIQMGKQDVIFAGGCEELDWTLSVLFDAMGAMSSSFNQTPQKASRAYDVDRDGFVIAGGAGVLVLEELEHAKARGGRIYGEVAGYGATSDGFDMVAPSGEGAVRCMKMALKSVKAPVDYINPHATSTPIGDVKEIEAIREVFGEQCPPIAATKSLTGHSLGAAGAQEAIYSLLMMNNGFICESANVENLDPAFADVPIVRERRDNVKLGCVLSNSFGFGGTNASVVLKRLDV